MFSHCPAGSSALPFSQDNSPCGRHSLRLCSAFVLYLSVDFFLFCFFGSQQVPTLKQSFGITFLFDSAQAVRNLHCHMLRSILVPTQRAIYVHLYLFCLPLYYWTCLLKCFRLWLKSSLMWLKALFSFKICLK